LNGFGFSPKYKWTFLELSRTAKIGIVVDPNVKTYLTSNPFSIANAISKTLDKLFDTLK
jgi:hypothetical protein